MRRQFIIFFILLMFHRVFYSVDIGSDTMPTRFNTQQTLANGDRIAGFASLAGGFALDTNTVTGIFDSFFAVSGNIGLNFGTLVLNQDLILHNDAAINSLGTILANGHAFNLSPNIFCIPFGTGPGNCSITFLTNATANDDIFAVDWNTTSEYIAIGLPTNTGNEFIVYSWNGTNLTVEDGIEFGRPVNTVKWHPTNNWVALGTNGSGSDEVFIYEFAGSTLTLLDSINIGAGGADIRSVVWRPQGDFLAIGSDDNTQEVVVYAVNGSGIFGASTSLNLTEDVNTVDWNYNGSYLVIGTDANAAINELQVYSFTTAPSLTLDSSFDTSAAIFSVAWNKVSPNQNIIAVGLPTGTEQLQMYRHTPGNLTNLPTGLGITNNVNSLSWHPDGMCLAAGLENNSDTEIRTFIFNNDTLLFDDGIELSTEVNSVAWSPSGSYLASGDDANNLSIFQLDQAFIDTTEVFFSNIYLTMNNNLSLKDTSITFSGNSTINGMNNTLTLAPTFSLVVNEGGTLLLKNITIAGINDSKIKGLDSSSTFSLQNVTFILNGDYNFSSGRLEILDNFKLSGEGNSFIYSSNTQSIIRDGFLTSTSCSPFSSGTLIIDTGVTFSYAPTNNNPNLILLENTKSKILLNNGNLVASALSLSKGILELDGKSTIQATNSITFGDGTLANNLQLVIQPAANALLMGTIINNNVN